jgi:hypothetical protein
MGFVRSIIIVVGVRCALTLNVALAMPTQDPVLGIAFDRAASTAAVSISQDSSLLLRADRDITALRISVSPAEGAQSAGAWRLRVITLARTESLNVPDLMQVGPKSTLWKVSRTIERDRPAQFTIRAQVPKATYENWLLVAEPADTAASEVTVHVNAVPVDQAIRVQWLMVQRNHYDPTVDFEAVRAIIRQLTDAEVRYWIGWLGRENVLMVWRRPLTDQQLEQLMPGPELRGFFRPAHLLPDGRKLHAGT